MIATLESLRDIGNTVIVVEHDEDTIRAADHVVEMGPGPGVHGGDAWSCRGRSTTCWRARRRRRGSSSPAGGRSPRPARRRTGNGKRWSCAGARENNLKSVDVTFPARHARGHHRRLRVGQEHAGQRGSLQGAVEAAGGHADAAGRARRGGRPRARPQGRQHRPVADRPEQPLEPGDVRRLLRHDPRPVHAGAALGRARLQGGPVQLQRQGRPVRGVPGRRRRSPRSSTSCPTWR